MRGILSFDITSKAFGSRLGMVLHTDMDFGVYHWFHMHGWSGSKHSSMGLEYRFDD